MKPTNRKENIMTNSHDIKVLKELANVNEDAAEFYETAQESVKDDTYKTTFSNLESLHESVASNVVILMKSYGEDYDADETMKGQAMQFWTQTKAMFSGSPNETFIKDLEEAEDRCLHSMQDAVSDTKISDTTRARLQNELTSLRKAHDYMKSLKENLKAA